MQEMATFPCCRLSRARNRPRPKEPLGPAESRCLPPATGKPNEALQHFKQAVALAPDDGAAHLGMAQTLETLGVANWRTPNTAECWRSTSLPQRPSRREKDFLGWPNRFQGAWRKWPRPDAIMYLVDALERFQTMDKADVERITFEIAMLGRSGLDVNDPKRTYRLSSLPGEHSGLNLVCLMYAGMKAVAPELDIGFDLSAEYEAALKMSGGRS